MDKESHAKAHQPSWAAVAKGPFPLVSSRNPQSKPSVSGSYAKVTHADLGSAVWLSQARQSPVDPSTGKVRCRACGIAFVSYTSLAQHLGSKHGGLNSEDSKYAQLRLHASASQSHQKPIYESQESMFPDISASRPHASAERPETSSLMHTHEVEELPRSATQPASSNCRQSVKLSGILKTAEPTSTTTSHMRHTGTSKPSAKILMSNTLRISVKPTKTKNATTGVQRGGSVASSARTLLFGKQGPGDKHGRKPRMDPSVIPEGLRLKGAHKPRMSKLKQQILRHRADQALIAAQKAHEGASQAFLKLLAECEALLGQLKSVAESLGLPIDQLQDATVAKPDAVPNLTAVEPRTSSPVAADPSLRVAASAGTEVMALSPSGLQPQAGTEVMALSPRLQPQASPVQLSVLQRALKTAEAKLRKAESELDGTQQRLRDRVRERAKVYKLDVEMEEQEADVQLGCGAGGVIEEQVVREEVLRGQKLEEAAPKEQETKKGFSLSAEATGTTIALLSQAASSQVTTTDQEVPTSDVSGMVHITAAKDTSGSTIAAAPLSSSQALPGGVAQTRPQQLSLLRKPLAPNLLTSSLMGGDDDDDDDTSDSEEEEEGTGALPRGWTDTLSSWAGHLPRMSHAITTQPGPIAEGRESDSEEGSPSTSMPATESHPSSHAPPMLLSATTSMAAPGRSALVQGSVNAASEVPAAAATLGTSQLSASSGSTPQVGSSTSFRSRGLDSIRKAIQGRVSSYSSNSSGQGDKNSGGPAQAAALSNVPSGGPAQAAALSNVPLLPSIQSDESSPAIQSSTTSAASPSAAAVTLLPPLPSNKTVRPGSWPMAVTAEPVSQEAAMLHQQIIISGRDFPLFALSAGTPPASTTAQLAQLRPSSLGAAAALRPLTTSADWAAAGSNQLPVGSQLEQALQRLQIHQAKLANNASTTSSSMPWGGANSLRGNEQVMIQGQQHQQLQQQAVQAMQQQAILQQQQQQHSVSSNNATSALLSASTAERSLSSALDRFSPLGSEDSGQAGWAASQHPYLNAAPRSAPLVHTQRGEWRNEGLPSRDAMGLHASAAMQGSNRLPIMHVGGVSMNVSTTELAGVTSTGYMASGFGKVSTSSAGSLMAGQGMVPDTINYASPILNYTTVPEMKAAAACSPVDYTMQQSQSALVPVYNFQQKEGGVHSGTQIVPQHLQQQVMSPVRMSENRVGNEELVKLMIAQQQQQQQQHLEWQQQHSVQAAGTTALHTQQQQKELMDINAALLEQQQQQQHIIDLTAAMQQQHGMPTMVNANSPQLTPQQPSQHLLWSQQLSTQQQQQQQQQQQHLLHNDRRQSSSALFQAMAAAQQLQAPSSLSSTNNIIQQQQQNRQVFVPAPQPQPSHVLSWSGQYNLQDRQDMHQFQQYQTSTPYHMSSVPQTQQHLLPGYGNPSSHTMYAVSAQAGNLYMPYPNLQPPPPSTPGFMSRGAPGINLTFNQSRTEIAPTPTPHPQFVCIICNVQCNSTVNLDQHFASRKHISKAARLAAAGVDAAARELHNAAGESLPTGSKTLVGPKATVHSLCRQLITADLNVVVTDLLLRVKGFQDRAVAKNAIKAASRRWYVCGLREVRKAVKMQRAQSVVIAPNIEQMEAVGGLDDHLQEILTKCEELKLPVVFALTRKRLGQIYGSRKRVSAVALLDFHGVEELHVRMVELMREGCMEWEERIRVEGVPPVQVLDEAEEEEEEDAQQDVGMTEGQQREGDYYGEA